MQWKHAFERSTHGVARVTHGWLVVNAADAQWIHHPDFGWQCPFVVRQREDIEPVRFFPHVGVNNARSKNLATRSPKPRNQEPFNASQVERQ